MGPRAEASNADDQCRPDNRPWDAPGACRRDSLPHRGLLLWRPVAVALCLVPISIVLPCISVVTGALCLFVLVLAHKDLKAMQVGEVDRAGKKLTQDAYWGAGCGFLLAVACISVWATCLIALWLRSSGPTVVR